MAPPRHDSIGTGRGVEVDVDQNCPRPADHVSAETAARQLHQMRETTQLTEDGCGTFAGIRARPGSDSGDETTDGNLLRHSVFGSDSVPEMVPLDRKSTRLNSSH